MTDRNWEAELAKIDKQLASISDDQLLAERKPVAAGKGTGAAALPSASRASAPAPAASVRSAAEPARGTWRGWLKVTIAIAAAAGLMYWPWPARCGLPLIGFTTATGGVALLGLWSAVGTWRHRLGLAHVASLLVLVWGLALGAREVLPRVGYAIPTPTRAAGWSCDALPTTAPVIPTAVPNGVPPVTPAPASSPTSPLSTPATTAPGRD